MMPPPQLAQLPLKKVAEQPFGTRQVPRHHPFVGTPARATILCMLWFCCPPLSPVRQITPAAPGPLIPLLVISSHPV